MELRDFVMFMFSFGNSFNHEKEQDQTHYHHDEHGGKEHPKQKPKTQDCEEQNDMMSKLTWVFSARGRWERILHHLQNPNSDNRR